MDDADDDDGATYSWIDVEVGGFGGKASEFVYNQPFRGFEPDSLLTLDESPNDWYGSFQRAVVTGLREGKRKRALPANHGADPPLEPDPAAARWADSLPGRITGACKPPGFCTVSSRANTG